jgi:hypothetical protein
MIFLIGIVCLSFISPAILWLLNIAVKSKLKKISNIQEFKKHIKIRAALKWFKAETNYPIAEIINDLVQMKEKYIRRQPSFSFTLVIVLFGVYLVLAQNIVDFYIRIKTGQVMMHKDILMESLTLIALSIWISGVLFYKLSVSRLNIFIDKVKEFENCGNAK